MAKIKDLEVDNTVLKTRMKIIEVEEEEIQYKEQVVEKDTIGAIENQWDVKSASSIINGTHQLIIEEVEEDIIKEEVLKTVNSNQTWTSIDVFEEDVDSDEEFIMEDESIVQNTEQEEIPDSLSPVVIQEIENAPETAQTKVSSLSYEFKQSKATTSYEFEANWKSIKRKTKSIKINS